MPQLWVPPQARRYTRDDLLAAARELQCHDIQPRTIRTFIEQGLLDHPRREAGGHGGGSSRGWWPRAQFGLWCTLLQQRKQFVERGGHKARVHATLCNVVVAAWLYFGEASGIPLRQVRRAMRTWAEANLTASSVAEAKRAAKRFVRLGAHPLADGRWALREQLTEMLLTGRSPEREEWLYRMKMLVDPRDRGEAKGPPEAPLSAEILTDLVLGRAEMIQKLRGGEDELPAGLWEWARFVLLWSRGWYQDAQPRLAEDPSMRKHPELAELYHAETFETLVNAACANLLTVLAVSGLALRATHPPPELRPEPWLAGRVRLRVRARQRLSALLQLDGGRQAYVEESVQLIWS